MTTRRCLMRRVLGALAAALVAGTAVPPAGAQAQVSVKISTDLQPLARSTSGTPAPSSTWLRSLEGQPHVKVLIVAPSWADPDLASLRRDIVGRGGSVFYNYQSLRAVAAMVPTTSLTVLAARSDVSSISPNRSASCHASLLQAAAGAGTELQTLAATTARACAPPSTWSPSGAPSLTAAGARASTCRRSWPRCSAG